MTENSSHAPNVSWSSVRSIGEVKILARASLLLIVIVPFLADIWPVVTAVSATSAIAIQAGIDGGEEGMAATVNALQLTDSILVSNTASCASPKTCIAIRGPILKLLPVLSGAREQLRTAAYSLTQSTKPRFPHTLSLLFFSAIFVFLGQLIYQSYAPRIVKSFKMEDYVMSQLQTHEKSRSDVRIRRCCSLLNREIPADADQYELFEIIELGAKEEYELSDQKNRPAALAATLSYVVAALLIACVVSKQVLSVGRESGWF